MTGNDLAILLEDMKSRGLLNKDIACFDYDESAGPNWLTVYKDDKFIMAEYVWNGSKFEYGEFDGNTGEAL